MKRMHADDVQNQKRAPIFSDLRAATAAAQAFLGTVRTSTAAEQDKTDESSSA